MSVGHGDRTTRATRASCMWLVFLLVGGRAVGRSWGERWQCCVYVMHASLPEARTLGRTFQNLPLD